MLLDRQGGRKDVGEAARLLRRVRDTGHDLGHVTYGNCLRNGRGRSELPGAIRYSLVAAEKETAAVMPVIGTICDSGKAEAVDLGQSITGYTRAAEKKNLSGLVKLGKVYNGGERIAKNCTKAFRFYKRAVGPGRTLAIIRM
jgi:TPR repeat protein